jgi:hypothetical protein
MIIYHNAGNDTGQFSLQMKSNQFWIITVGFMCCLLPATQMSNEEQEYSVNRYDETPGLYYEALGETTSYNTEWKPIVYVNLNEINSETEQLGQYVDHVNAFCRTTQIQNWTDCNHFSTLAKDRLHQIRGILNFVGEISKFCSAL